MAKTGLPRVTNWRDVPVALAFAAALAALAFLSACTSGADPSPSPTSAPTASPTSTQSPSPTALATPTPTPSEAAATPTAGPVASPQEIPVPPERDLYDLGRRLVLKTVTPVGRLASPPPPALKQGDAVTWMVNRDQGMVNVSAHVQLVTGHAYWIFEDSYPPDQASLDAATETFESVIWPAVTGALGDIWTPGVDGDPRLVIFHGKLRSGVAGYYSSVDEYPVLIQPNSNQREVIYISVDNLPLGSTAYHSTLAHELQHAVHWVADPGEESWVNEGISELASKLAGYPPGSVNSYLRSPNTSLLDWEPNIFQASPNYGAASLFFEYIFDHYGGAQTIKAIIENPSDGIASVDESLAARGYGVTMLDVFRDMLVANLADDGEGNFANLNRDTPLPFMRVISAPRDVDDSVRPFGASYYSINSSEQNVTISFSGSTEGQIFPAPPRSGDTCWWTNAGDSIDSTLTRHIDLTGVSEAALTYHVWTSIEEDWDYLYVVVSTDNGATWDILPTALTTSQNPNGGAYGPGITGESGQWLEDTVNLSIYAGREVLLRFEYITDDAVNGRGACLDDFAVPAIGWTDDTTDNGSWTASGFTRINDRQPVEYLVMVIRDPAQGLTTAERIDIGPDGKGEITVPAGAIGERLAVVVSVITPSVGGELEYTLQVE